MNATTLKAVYNGKTFTRKTARTYTHAVACTHNPQNMSWRATDVDGIVAWCGSHAIAIKALRQYSKPQFGFAHVEIVPVSAT
jgi:hypothetical protein